MADTAARFRALAEDAVTDLLQLDPEHATDLGDHRYDDRLTDLSETGLAHAAARYADHRDELDSLDADELDPADAVDAEILRAGLDRRVFEIEQLREHTWNPLLWLPIDALYLLVSRDTLPLEDRLQALGGRLRAVPERLAVARTTLENMPRVHVETALTQISGLITMLRDEIPPLAGTAARTFMRVEPMRTAAEDALVEHRDWLLDQLEDAEGDPRLGPALYAARLHLTLDADLSAERIAAAAREHLDAVTEELTELAVGWVGPGEDAVRRAFDRVAAEAPDNATIVALAGRALAEATELVTGSGILRVPGDPVEIEVMPELRRGVAIAYCDAPGPLETGGVTRFAISPTPVGLAGRTGGVVLPGVQHRAGAEPDRARGHARARRAARAGPPLPGHHAGPAGAGQRLVHRGLGRARRGDHGPARLRRGPGPAAAAEDAAPDDHQRPAGRGRACGRDDRGAGAGADDRARLPGGGRGRRQVAAGPADQHPALDVLRRLHRAGPDAGRPDHVRRGARARQPATAAPAGPAGSGREPGIAGMRRTGMRRRLAAAVLLAALPLAGCGGSAGSTPGSPPDPPATAAAPTVTLQRGGGIAGVRDTVTVQPDGSWRRTAGTGPAGTGTLPAGQRDRLARMAADPALRAEATRTVPETECADGFDYRLTAGDTEVAWRECGSATTPPPVAGQIAALLLTSTK